MKPLVAIVGRPNVGKSMLFNKLIGQRLSIVEDTPGVTRDRIYGESEWCGRKFRLVDTGGIEPRTDDQILSFMREQAEIAERLCLSPKTVNTHKTHVYEKLGVGDNIALARLAGQYGLMEPARAV